MASEIFLAMPPVTSDGQVFFGKNFLGPVSEVHEVIYVPSSVHEPESKLMCTYKEIQQSNQTYAVVLSKPISAWGAEMGANEHGVCIGCSLACKTQHDRNTFEEKLLSIDLVRLGLERSSSAREALDVIVALLKTFGLASDDDADACGDSRSRFCSSFLICDAASAWVVEVVADGHWAAQNITSGFRCVTGVSSIKTQIDLASEGCKEYAVEQKWWSDELGDFDFSLAFGGKSGQVTSEESSHENLLSDLAARGSISSKDMLDLLRNASVEYDRSSPQKFVSVSSQMSVLCGQSSGKPCCHWFTATPFPSKSLFKPFIFCDGASVGDKVVSREVSGSSPKACCSDDTPALYTAHREFLGRLETDDSKAKITLQQLHELESNCLQDVEDVMRNFDVSALPKVSSIFHHIADIELNFY